MSLIRDAVPSPWMYPSSGRLMTGRLVVQFLAGLTDPFIHSHMYNWMSNDLARSVNAFPRVDMLSLLRSTRSLLVSVPSSIEVPYRPIHHRHTVCHLRERAEELFSEHRMFSQKPSAVSGFTRIMRAIVSSSSSDLQPHH